jgi:hypothetical protein
VRHIGNKIRKLESILIRQPVHDRWGTMAALRENLIHQTPPSRRDSLRLELEALGPVGLWCETARRFLADHGFVQSQHESLAETMARALEIGIEELRALIAQGQIGRAITTKLG